MSTFSERLQRMRERRRVKRYVFSETCGLHPDAIRRYEREEATPTMDALWAIADELEVSTDYLIGRTDDPFVYNPSSSHKKF